MIAFIIFAEIILLLSRIITTLFDNPSCINLEHI